MTHHTVYYYNHLNVLYSSVQYCFLINWDYNYCCVYIIFSFNSIQQYYSYILIHYYLFYIKKRLILTHMNDDNMEKEEERREREAVVVIRLMF